MKFRIPTLGFTTLLVGICSLLAACSGTETPIDERQSKDHGDPSKMVITLTHGKLNQQSFTAQVSPAAPELGQQVMTYKLDSSGWQPTADSPDTLRYLLAADGHDYELRIRYFDLQGNDITYQFCTNGQDKIHQHFFIPRECFSLDGRSRTRFNENNGALDYTYLDTTPWDKDYGTSGVVLNASDNPIGFKGVLRFKEALRFLLSIELMHARESKIPSATQQISPFYKPSAAQRNYDLWDVKTQVPMKAVVAP